MREIFNEKPKWNAFKFDDETTNKLVEEIRELNNKNEAEQAYLY